jgi:hypothetical protein
MEVNIKMYLKGKILWQGLDAYDAGKEQVASCFQHGNEHSGSLKFIEFLG